jgi:hypothetical protein
MWVEAILSRDDLTRILGEALPVAVQLGDASAHHSLALYEPEAVTLVADRGLRLVCKARLHWPVLGIELPIVLHTLTVDLRPEIGRHDGHDALFFRVEIAESDVAGVPAILDRAIAQAINARLEETRGALKWDFTKTLSGVLGLPAILDPLEGFALEVAWGKIRVTDEAVILAVSFHSRVHRRDDPTPREALAPRAEPPRAAAPVRRHAAPPLGADAKLLRAAAIAAAFGLAAGAGYFALRAFARRS